MKQQWSSEELLSSWTLTDTEKALVNSYRTDHNSLAFGTLLKCFQYEGKFPQRKQDIPKQIIMHISQQIHVPHTLFDSYGWGGGTFDRHRAHIRSFLGFRPGTVADAKDITAWLAAQALTGEDRQIDRLKELVYKRYYDLKIEPPEQKSIDRLIRSAIRTADETFYTTTTEKLSAETKKKLDALLDPATLPDGTPDTTSLLQQLRSDAGAITVESVLAEIEKLQHIRSLGLPLDLFSQTQRKIVSWYRSRVAVEDLQEIRRHPEHIRYTLLSAYCFQREQEIIDTLLDLLISIIHKIETRAEKTVNAEILQDAKRIQGKHKLLFEVAKASLEKPEGKVKDVIYPVVGEKTLRDLVEEVMSNGSYQQKVQVLMRGSYSNHYRRIVPLIFKALAFSATSTAPKALLTAIELLRKYADKNMAYYPETEEVEICSISWHF